MLAASQSVVLLSSQKSLCQQRQCKLELVAQAKADIRHLDAEYHLLLDSVRQVYVIHYVIH